MNQIPLSQKDVINNINTLLQTSLYSSKLISESLDTFYSTYGLSKARQYSENEALAKDDYTSEVEDSHCKVEADDFNNFPFTPSKSSSTKHGDSSLQKKSIRKDRTSEKLSKSARKLKFWIKLREKKAKRAQESQQGIEKPFLDMSPRKLFSHLMTCRGKEEMELIEEMHMEQKDLFSTPSSSSFESSQSTQNSECSPQSQKGTDRSVHCLNNMSSGVKKLNISGINVFLNDDDHEYSFPSQKKTIKFIV